MPKHRINVSQKNIDDGFPEDPTCCPIALAISEDPVLSARFGLHYVSGSGLQKRPNSPGKEPELEVKFPEFVFDFVQDFDNELPVKPISFEIEYD